MNAAAYVNHTLLPSQLLHPNPVQPLWTNMFSTIIKTLDEANADSTI